jgi:inward rectifier potassium channel
MAAQKQTFDPGLTQQFTGDLRRAINKDGSFNVHRRGVPLSSRNPYLFLVDCSWTKFIICFFFGFLFVNLLFAEIYVLIGIKDLVGESSNTGVGPFMSAFFFSVHTLTTVGYGDVYPKGIAANWVAAIEAMLGLMGFALGTGLLYARFSRPSARILFSERVLIAPYQGMTALEFRVANQRSNVLMDLQATVIFMTVERANGELRRKFAELPLERQKVFFIPLTWTIVHPIDNGSPLYGLTQADLDEREAEFLVVAKGFDETFAQTVNARYSYRHDEIIWGAKFLPAFVVDKNGDLVLELDRINAVQNVPLPSHAEIESATAPTQLPGM